MSSLHVGGRDPSEEIPAWIPITNVGDDGAGKEDGGRCATIVLAREDMKEGHISIKGSAPFFYNGKAWHI